MACRVALHRGVRQVIGVDPVDERLDRARTGGVTTLDLREVDDVAAVRDLTGGRGADAVVDAVGMEAHGSVVEVSHTLVAALPDVVARKLMTTVGIDRLAAVRTAVDSVRRGGTISLSGVYGGMADPMPMTLFDKQVQLRMGQANVKRWVPEILPLLTDDDPLGVDGFATHRLPLDAAPGLRRLPGQEGRHGQGRAEARDGGRADRLSGDPPDGEEYGERVARPLHEVGGADSG